MPENINNYRKIKCAGCGMEMQLVALDQIYKEGDIKCVCEHCNTMLYKNKERNYQSTTFNYKNWTPLRSR